MDYTQAEIEAIKKIGKKKLKPIRVTIAVGTVMHSLLSHIANTEEVHPNAVVRAMVKAALVEWLNHASSYYEFNEEERIQLPDEQI